jgi:hypothetical protein
MEDWRSAAGRDELLGTKQAHLIDAPLLLMLFAEV